MPYDNNNSGVLFKNKKKEQPNHPDYEGSCEIDGVQYWLKSWIKEGKQSGEKFMSLSFRPKDDKGGSKGTAKSGAAKGKSDDDDFPY